MEAFTLTELDAVTVARALIVANNKFREEYEKIATGPDVSEFIKEAASKQYHELSNANTQLHVTLAQHFPVLRQP